MKGTSANGPARRRRRPMPEPLPDALRRLLARARLTEGALAKLASRSLRSINRVICGRTELTVDMACQIAGPLRTRADRLLIIQARHAAWKHQRARGRTERGQPTAEAGDQPPDLRLVEPAARDGQRGTLTPTERAGSKTGPGGGERGRGANGAPLHTASPSSRPDQASPPPSANGSASSAPRRKRSRQEAASDESGSSRAASA